MPDFDRMELLEMSIDEKLGEVRELSFVDDVSEEAQQLIAQVVRAAYAKGVGDVLRDPKGMAEWWRSYGYKLPGG